MKKSVIMLCLFLLIFSSWFAMKNFTNVSLSKVVNLLYYRDPTKNFSDMYQLQITHTIDDTPSKEFHENFETILKENHIYALKIVYTFENETNRELIQFTYTTNADGIEKRVWLDGSEFNPNIVEKYSTDSVDRKTHIASFLNNQEIVEAYPFVMDESNGGMYNLLAEKGYEDNLKENIDVVIGELQKKYPEIQYGLSNYADAQNIGDFSEPSILKSVIEYTYSQRVTIVGVTGVLFILLCSKFLSLRRKISIMKIEGISSGKIFYRLYEKDYLIGIVSCLLVICIVSYMYYKNNFYAFRGLLLAATVEFLAFALTQQILSLAFLPMIEFMPIVSSEKGKNNLRKLYYFSYVVKLFAIILLVPRMINIIPNIQSYILMKSRFNKTDASLQNYYFFNTRYASDYFTDFGSENYNNVYETFTKNHLIRFNRDYLYENELEMIPCYVTKVEYIEDQGLIKDGIDYDHNIVIYLKEGQEYDLDKIKYYVQFKTFENSDIDIIYYENSPKTYSPYELLFSDYTNGDPIVCLPEEDAVKGQIEGSIIYYDGTLDEAQSYVDSVFNEYGYSAALRMGPAVKRYEQYYSYYKNIYSTNIFKLLLMLIAYFLAHRLLVNTDIECNKTRYYLSKVEGVLPYKFKNYIVKIASPMIIGLLLLILKEFRSSLTINIVYSALFLLIIEFISYLWFKYKTRRIRR